MDFKRGWMIVGGVLVVVVGLGGGIAWMVGGRAQEGKKMARPTASGAAVAVVAVADDGAGAYFVKLVDRARRGTAEERAIAQDALRMAPAPALAALREGARAGGGPVELKGIMAAQETARARYAADVARESAYGASVLAAYGRVGKGDKIWDGEVRAVLEALFVRPVAKGELAARVKRLESAGCPDALAAHAVLVGSGAEKHSLNEQLAVARDMKESEYPASLTLYATGLAARTAFTQTEPVAEAVRVKLRSLLGAGLGRVSELQGESLVQDRLADILLSLVKGQAVADRSTLLAAWDKLEPGFRSALPGNAVVDCVGGDVCEDEGWRLRGTKFVAQSSAEGLAGGMRLFARSDAYCDAALKIDPAFVRCARLRLMNLRHGGATRDEVMGWFRRCAEMDPDSGKAVRILAELSMGRWGGGSDWKEEIWRCAKVAALSRNFEAGVPQEVSFILSRLRMDLTEQEREKFWSTDEVRAIVRYVFDESIRLSPTDEKAGNGLLLYWFIGDGPSARRTLLRFPADFLPKGDWYWAERWPSIRQRILAIPENAPIPDQGPPTWAP